MTGTERHGWRFEWLTSWDEVWDPAFVSQWQKWMDESPDAHVFFHPALVRAWVETYRELRRIEPRFLIARRGRDCTVFFPLVLDRGGWKDAWLRVLRPVGYTEFDYHDPIWCGERREEEATAYWRALRDEVVARGEGDVLSVPRVRDGREGEEFTAVNGAPLLNLNDFESFDDVLANVHSQLRNTIRRRQRQLTKVGEFHLHIFPHDELDRARTALAHFEAAHRHRWPNAYKPEGFHRRLLSHGLPAGVVHFSALECGDEAISWHLGFAWCGRFYYYLPAFRQDRSRYSPGTIHTTKLVESSMRDGIEVFDFLTGRERYKTWWTKKSVVLYGLSLCLPGVRPRLRNTSRTLLRRTASLMLRRHV